MRRTSTLVGACAHLLQGHALSRHGFFSLIIALLTLSSLTSAVASTYDYDGNGRLRSATNANGDAAYYDYDDRGNLVRIKRAVAQLGISSFTPNNGSSGIQVLIKGAGFASTTVDNDVRFNGVAAPVLAASASQLLVMVPQNATTGKISVTANSATVVSADDFQVSQLAPPAITSFTPTAGAFGTTVTINGSNLNPYPGASTVEINGIYIPTTYIDDAQAIVVIPPYVGTGPVTVTTPFGKVTTSGWFYVLPTGMDASTISFNAPLTLDAAPQPVTLTASLPNAAYYFNANDGDYVSIQSSSFTSSASTSYSVISPTQGVVATGTISAASPTVHLPEMQSTGAYSIYFSGGASAPQFSFVIERNQILTIDGSTTVAPATTGGQGKRFTFTANQGDNIGVGLYGLSATGNGAVSVSMYRPDGVALLSGISCSASRGGCEWNRINMPLSGTYSILILPSSASQSLSFSMQASTAAEAALVIGGGSVSLPIQRRGQAGFYRFQNTTANQLVTLSMSGMTPVPMVSPSINWAAVTVYNPDGTQLTTWAGMTSANTFSLTLVQTGQYAVYVEPWDARTMTPQATLVSSPAIPITVDGGVVLAATQFAGETKRFTFTANQGDNIGVGLYGLSATGNGTVSVSIYRPDGVALMTGASCSASWVGCDWDPTNLPMSGTYTISVFMSSASQTASFTLGAWNDLTGTLTANNSVHVDLNSRGRDAWLTFGGTAGTSTTIRIVPIGATTFSKAVQVTVYKPDGSSLATAAITQQYTFTLANLPTTGTYKVFIDPGWAVTADMNVMRDPMP